MARMQKGGMRDDLIREIVEEQNEFQDIVIELLKVDTETHPEIALNYIGYEKKIKEGRK